jgi:hypothetical protein
LWIGNLIGDDENVLSVFVRGEFNCDLISLIPVFAELLIAGVFFFSAKYAWKGDVQSPAAGLGWLIRTVKLFHRDESGAETFRLFRGKTETE